MEIPFLLLQTVLIPAVSVPIMGLLGKKIGKQVGWVVTAVLAYTTFLLLLGGVDYWVSGSALSEQYFWSTALFDIEFGFLADGLSYPVAVIMNILSMTLAVYSIRYVEHAIEELYGDGNEGMNGLYYGLFMFFPTGLVGMSLATNLVEIYLFLDVLLIPLYFIISYFGLIKRHRIATMVFLWGFIGGSLFLIGSVMVYSQIGSLMIRDLPALAGSPLAFWAAIFMLVGILTKMAAFGFHVWLPWVHSGAPTPVSGILTVVVGIMSYLLGRIFVQNLATVIQALSTPLMIWALITMLYGGLLTLAQDDIKRLYACSTISQTAYSLLGLATLTTTGAAGGVFYFLSHSLGKVILFSAAGMVMIKTDVRDINKMGGLAKKMPLTATLCVMGSLILSAIPPFSGLQAEWIMFIGIFEQGVAAGTLLNIAIPVAGIFITFISSVYTFWPVMRIFFGPLPKSLEDVEEAPLSMIGPTAILALISFLFGIYPELVMRFLSAAF
ncbi:MAG: NADH dehydrogenase [Candidatus Thorarchaeota archaeon]|nr:NADH dehydrogenase [Candidatus Thorarchaeota archaeon]